MNVKLKNMPDDGARFGTVVVR